MIGEDHSYSGFEGIIAGEDNQISGTAASVLGGETLAALFITTEVKAPPSAGDKAAPAAAELATPAKDIAKLSQKASEELLRVGDAIWPGEYLPN